MRFLFVLTVLILFPVMAQQDTSVGVAEALKPLSSGRLQSNISGKMAFRSAEYLMIDGAATTYYNSSGIQITAPAPVATVIDLKNLPRGAHEQRLYTYFYYYQSGVAGPSNWSIYGLEINLIDSSGYVQSFSFYNNASYQGTLGGGAQPLSQLVPTVMRPGDNGGQVTNDTAVLSLSDIYTLSGGLYTSAGLLPNETDNPLCQPFFISGADVYEIQVNCIQFGGLFNEVASRFWIGYLAY